MKARSRSYYGAVWIAVVMLLLASCAAPPQEPPTEQPATEQPATPVATEQAPPTEAPSPAADLVTCYSVDNQVVVLGIGEQIDQALESVDREKVGYEIIRDPESLGETGLDGAPFDTYVLLSAVPPSDSPPAQEAPYLAEILVEEIRGTKEAKEGKVFASLNHKSHIFGWSGGDSPFGKIPHEAQPPPGGLVDQAALRDVLSLPVPDPQSSEERSTVVVGVFDTAPDIGISVDTGVAFRDLADHIKNNPPSVSSFTNSRDHGVFVSSLISATAPGADIYLHRVLNDDGLGNTVDILDQVRIFLEDHREHNGPRVLNFSLGIWCSEPPPPDWLEEARPVEVLDTLLTEVHKNNTVIVAAAGNDSNRLFDSPNNIFATTYPASGSFAISVGATNPRHGGPSCYSHRAEVFAPGGDGDESATPIGTPIPEIADVYCVPAHDTCADAGCEYGLVGLSADSATGYAYWSGTSFATPLVSGLVVRLLASRVPASDVESWILRDECAPIVMNPPDPVGERILGDISGCLPSP